MNKIISIDAAVDMIFEGASVMIGGFMGCGNAHSFVDALAKKGTGNLTLICNDGALLNGPDGGEFYGVAKLINNRQITKMIATHVGLNPQVGQQSMIDKTLEVQLVPQGSFAEMIRAGGAGLGGVLTPTGVGTLVEQSPLCINKQNIDGKDYLLMKPLRADFAIVFGTKVDEYGNVWYKGTTSNFNIVMATAADTVIVEAQEIVDSIIPEDVRTPAILVDHIVRGGICCG